MASPPAPYNITISSQCPNFQYYPARDGLINQGWNVTYSGSNDSQWYFDGVSEIGVGIPSHRTALPGAYVELRWLGTAIYLYGSVSPYSVHSIQVDGIEARGTGDLNSGLLARVIGLPYGPHKLHLSTGDNQVLTLRGAVLTVGLGGDG